MSKTIKLLAVILLAGILVFHYHDEIQSFLNSLPFSIPFLTEKDEENEENKGSYEYYFKDNFQNESQEESVWNIYEK